MKTRIEYVKLFWYEQRWLIFGIAWLVFWLAIAVVMVLPVVAR